MIFETRAAAQRAVVAIDDMGRRLLADMGYSFADVEAAHRQPWDVPTQAPTGVWYIASPRDRFSVYADDLLEGVDGREIEMPPEWRGSQSLQ